LEPLGYRLGIQLAYLQDRLPDLGVK